MGGGFGQAQAALAPKKTGQFLNQMLLGRPLVLGDERRNQVAISAASSLRSTVKRDEATWAYRVEAGDLRSRSSWPAAWTRSRSFPKAPFTLEIVALASLVGASSRCAVMGKSASSARSSASKACSCRRS